MQKKATTRTRRPKPDRIGEIELQVMWSRLIAVVEEQAQTLLRTAFSSIVREAGDLSAGVFDRRGRMLAQAVTGTPGHVNSMAESVVHFIRHFPLETMRPGDIYICNDPWMGTGHLNDFVLTTPCFHRGKLIALFSCTSHLMDIGGIGFGPDATDVFMEGLYIPMLKLADGGELNHTLMSMIRANTRLPVDTEGDVYSLANCNDVGARRLIEMMEEFDLDDLDRLADHICDRSRAAVIAEIAKLPRGTWSNSMTVDGYDEPITLVAQTTIGEAGIHVDYTGTSPASKRGINVPMAYTTAYTVFGLGCVVASRIPNNAGSLSPLTVSAPPGTILNAPKPKPVLARHITGQMLPDVVFGCLRQAIPDRVPAEGTSCLFNITLRGQTGDQLRGNYGFATTFTSNGGTGARPMQDGLSATAYPSGVRGTPVEIAEQIMPVIFWRKEFREDSAGAGRTRGGLGQEIEIGTAIDRPFELLAAFDRIDHPPRGRDGGRNGEAAYVGLKSGKKLKGKGFQTIPETDRLVIRTPGGAGMGDPSERARDMVAADLADDRISPATARTVYGLDHAPPKGGKRKR
jgi:N-methylhydantoinase B